MATTNALQRGDIIRAEPPAAVRTLINVPYMLSWEHKNVQRALRCAVKLTGHIHTTA